MSWSPNNTESGGGTGGPRRGGLQASNIFDIPFVKSLGGILLIIQVVCAFLGLVLACSWRGSYTSGHVFFVLMMVALLLAAVSLFVTRAIRLDELLRRDIPWDVIMACYSAGAALLVLIASCVMVEAAGAVSALKAAGVFGLFAWNALLASTVLYGRPVWQQRMQHLPVAASATVTQGPEQSPVSGHDSSADDWSDDEDPVADGGADEGLPGVTLTRAKTRPTSYYGNTGASQSSLYPVDITGSKRASAVYNPTTETWSPG